MTNHLGIWPSWSSDRWKLCILPAPVRRFLLVAVELLPEQVITLTIIRDRHIEGTPLVLLPPLCQLHIRLAEVRVLDRKLRIRCSFCQPLTLCLLCRAPLHPGHVRCRVRRHFTIVGEAIDDIAHLASDPFEHWMKPDPGCFSTCSSHTVLLVAS